jgi:hypothetical protein
MSCSWVLQEESIEMFNKTAPFFIALLAHNCRHCHTQLQIDHGLLVRGAGTKLASSLSKFKLIDDVLAQPGVLIEEWMLAFPTPFLGVHPTRPGIG